jgi:GNAT superfamily N-acetyltransferase
MTMAHALSYEISLHWLEPGDDVRSVVAQRMAIYGRELGWIGAASEIAWDDYDRYSSTLVAYSGGELVASSRLTLERYGPLEVSDLVDWKGAVPGGLRGTLCAEWSRVMIAKQHRGLGLFRAMYAVARQSARARGARVLAGASVAELRPRYQRLGFHYLDCPFRSPFFASSPVYYPAYQVLR